MVWGHVPGHGVAVAVMRPRGGGGVLLQPAKVADARVSEVDACLPLQLLNSLQLKVMKAPVAPVAEWSGFIAGV